MKSSVLSQNYGEERKKACHNVPAFQELLTRLRCSCPRRNHTAICQDLGNTTVKPCLHAYVEMCRVTRASQQDRSRIFLLQFIYSRHSARAGYYTDCLLRMLFLQTHTLLVNSTSSLLKPLLVRPTLHITFPYLFLCDISPQRQWG